MNHRLGIYPVTNPGLRPKKLTYSYKKSRFGWMVFEVHTSQIQFVLPSKLRAMYACAKLNGTDLSIVFNFGDALSR